MTRVVVRWVPWVCGETVLTHPTPPSPFINLNYGSSWSKRLFSACLKIRNGFCCGSVSLKFSDCQAIWRELKLSSSSQIQDDY